MNDITNIDLIIIKERPGLYNTYKSDNGKSIDYALTSIAIVRNPYIGGKLDFAVKPYFEDEYGDCSPVFSYQEDMMYEECRRIIDECRKNETKVPNDVDIIAREIGQRKMRACEQANKYIDDAFADASGTHNAGFSKGKWRNIVIKSDIAKKLMVEAKEIIRQQKKKK